LPILSLEARYAYDEDNITVTGGGNGLSRITLSDGLVIAAFDGLPSSASRLP